MPNESQSLVAEVNSTLHQFLHMPNEHAFTVMSAWIAHSHLRGHDGTFLPERTGRIYFGSKEAGCGKTLALELTTLLSHNGEIHVNPTQFALVTSINIGLGTNGIDEIDRFFGTRGTAKVDLQTIILAGYRRGARVSRQRGDEIDWQNIHGPMATAGKNLNRFMTAECFETMRTRSFIIALERKPIDSDTDKYVSELHEPRLRMLSRRLARWGQHHGKDITSIDITSTMDRIGLDNRDEEIWSILFRIAHYIGGEWPHKMEAAARAMVLGQFDDDQTPLLSPSEELLMWCRAVFRDDEEFLPTRILLERIMSEADSSAWFRNEWKTSKAASMGLAQTLGNVYGIYADRVKQDRGYHRKDLLIESNTESETESGPVDISEWDWSEID